MDSIIFTHVIDYIDPEITTLVNLINIGDYISIDNGFELIQFRVGFILNMDGGIYLDNLLFLFGDNDAICAQIFEENGYLVPQNIPPSHVGWVATRWISVRELILALVFEGREIVHVVGVNV